MRFLSALRYRQAAVAARACPGSLLSARFSSTQPQRSLETKDVRTSSRREDGPSGSHRAVSVKPFSAIPGPKGLPFIGTALEWMRSGKMFKMSEMIQERVEKYGTIYREKMVPGLPEQVVITDPHDVKTVFDADGKWPFRQFGGEVQILVRKKAKLPNNLFTAQGKEWHDSRLPMQKFTMVSSRVALYHKDFNYIAEDLMNVISRTRDPETKELQDVTELLFRWSFETVSLFALGKRLGCLDEHPPPDTVEYTQWIETLFRTVLELSFSPPVHKFWEIKAMKACVEAATKVHLIAMKFIEERMKEMDVQNEPSNKEATDFLTSLIHSDKLNMEQATINVVGLHSAGVDTTAFALSWCLYLLATNAEKQEKLRSEVTRVLGSERIVTPKHINDMQYLRYCIKETLRLYPIAGTNPRRTQVDIILSGNKVPAGKEILMPQMVMGRLPQLFPEPDQFLPERWSKDNKNPPNPFASLPFGFGPRMCPGKQIAELELHIALAQLVRRYKVEYLEETPMDYVQKFMIQPDRKLNLVFADVN